MHLITVLESKDERVLRTTAEGVFLQFVVGKETVSEPQPFIAMLVEPDDADSYRRGRASPRPGGMR